SGLLFSAYTEPRSLLARLVSELTSSDVHTDFVIISSRIIRRIEIPEDLQRDLYEALIRLHDSGWGEQPAPGHPLPIGRPAILTEALNAWTPWHRLGWPLAGALDAVTRLGRHLLRPIRRRT